MKSIANLLKEDEDDLLVLLVFVDMLFKFTLQVRKLDGGLYPPTLAINRIIREQYELCALQTSSVAFPFSIMKDPRGCASFSQGGPWSNCQEVRSSHLGGRSACLSKRRCCHLPPTRPEQSDGLLLLSQLLRPWTKRVKGDQCQLIRVAC